MATTLTAQQFASQVSLMLGRFDVMRLNKKSGRDRLRNLVDRIERAVRYDQVEFEYSQAVYGLSWSVVTGRVNAETANAIEAMNTRQLCMLVYELKLYHYDISLYPSYLMNKYTKEAA